MPGMTRRANGRLPQVPATINFVTEFVVKPIKIGMQASRGNIRPAAT